MNSLMNDLFDHFNEWGKHELGNNEKETRKDKRVED